MPSDSVLLGKSVILYLWQKLPSTSKINAAYPSQSHLKGSSKTSGKIFYVRKTTNIGIGHDQQHAIYHITFCLMVIEKLFKDLHQWYDFSTKKNSIYSHFYFIYMINYFYFAVQTVESSCLRQTYPFLKHNVMDSLCGF